MLPYFLFVYSDLFLFPVTIAYHEVFQKAYVEVEHWVLGIGKLSLREYQYEKKYQFVSFLFFRVTDPLQW